MSTPAFLHTSPSAWSAIAAWAAVVLGVVAAIYAARQAREARRLRKEQARPYVVVFIDSSPAEWIWVDLVIRNLGRTAARNVRVSVDPSPRRAAGTDPEVPIPARIPILVPGQEWRTFWDGTHVRDGSELPRQHTATVRFEDSTGEEFGETFELDFGPLIDRTMINVYGQHDTAKALRDIKDTLASWKETPGGQGLRVFSRDGDARDARDRAEWDRRQAEHEMRRGSTGAQDGDGSL